MKNNILLFIILSLIISTQMYSQQFDGKANPEAVVISGNVRFTMLTPHIIRMEWSENGVFEDNASLTFIDRNLPVPKFEKTEADGYLQIKTDAALLKYKLNSGKFTSDNLQIEFETGGIKKIWKPGVENKGNLLGTTRTLDGVNGATKLEDGLLSTEGWSLVDDSERPLFDNSDWPWVMPRPENKVQDLYFFVYGYDYKTILKEYTEVAGKIALPPKFAFGYWWSRYWKYTDQEFRGLINEFKIHDVPLEVLVIDMDWHIVNRPEWYKNGRKLNDQSGESFGWTGFTWNNSVFPDPQKFLEYTDKLNIKTCLNLHPASGIQPHEAVYPAFAKAMGIDPETKKYVPFDITDKKYAQNFVDLVLRPMEKQGIDFWWLDWQQWGKTAIKGVNPTFYLNYVFFSDMERKNEKRALLYHRWGGLGNHRYQIGFSGDTFITWASLDYQPYFTSTASNVCYGFWSHDIGGHVTSDQEKNPELYTRWVEWGAFSPILRTHCTNNPDIERRIWAYPLDNFYAMRNAIKLRYSLIPYIYTEAREAYDTGVSMLRPMYYDYPKEKIAYDLKNQYMFGNDMIVAPVTHPLGQDAKGIDNLYTMQEIWLPEGNWIEWSSGSILSGGKTIERPFCLEEIPVYVKAGAIIPMQKDINNTADEKKDYLILNIFPGDSGRTKVYDDEGNNEKFKNGKFTFTNVSFSKTDEKSLNIEIAPIEGEYDGMPEARSYELRLPVSYPPSSVKVNGKEYNFNEDGKADSWNYNGNELASYIFTSSFSVHDKINIEVKFTNSDLSLLSGKKKLFSSLMKVAKAIQLSGWNEGKTNSDSVIAAAQTGERINYNPSSTVTELKMLDKNLPDIIKAVSDQAGKEPKLYKTLELLKASK
ncbi:MAG: glycoside hydrolase family 31 protein [Ignavibacteriaceae bacterium]|nr:glycoside hydrolase family 31 protein [Ignavibacteriaceae bacterium]